MKARNILPFILGCTFSVTAGVLVVSASTIDRAFFDTPTDAIVFTLTTDISLSLPLDTGENLITFRFYNDRGWSPWYRTDEGEADFRDEDIRTYDKGARESAPILVGGATVVQWRGGENTQNIRIV